MANKGGLGKGLNALLKDTKLTVSKDQVQKIAVDKIIANRYQPRQEFDESALEELTESIKRIGVLQPLLVRKLADGNYELIAGERRLRASKKAGLTVVPVMVHEYNDIQISEIALIENIQRENLNALEEARAYARLMSDFKLTQEEIAVKIGRSRSHIANFLRLLKLAPQVQEYLANGALTMGQAKPLIAIDNLEWQREAAEYIQAKDLSSRQSEALVKKVIANPDYLNPECKDSPLYKDKSTPALAKATSDVFVKDALDKLTQVLGTKIKIHSGKKKNKLEIEFHSDDDLNRILSALINQQSAVRQEKIAALRKASLSGDFTV